MVEIASVLRDHTHPGRFNVDDGEKAGVHMREVAAFSLVQIAAWPKTLPKVGRTVAKAAGMTKATEPGEFRVGRKAGLLRVEPLKWWILAEGENSVPALSLTSENGCLLDLSHSRVWVKVEGVKARDLLNRFLPIDFRDTAFPVGSVASTAFHHVGVTVWRGKDGFNLLLPRSFAASLWELQEESGKQFGLEIS